MLYPISPLIILLVNTIPFCAAKVLASSIHFFILTLNAFSTEPMPLNSECGGA